MSAQHSVPPVVLLELNEINFDFVRTYVSQGHLPTFARLLERHGLAETVSETRYEQLEPWIQWVTAHTGLTLAQHGVFRLGDIAGTELEQIWEILEREGMRVGAVLPMNAKNRTRNAAFFLPDPWTVTSVSGSRVLDWLYAALVQAVGDNAQGRIAPKSYAQLLVGLATHARPSSLPALLRLAMRRSRDAWTGALFLDRLLADVFVTQWRRHRPHFASLFLNAGAHIQHHYMFSSKAYQGPHRNPSWYVRENADPILETLVIYDRIAADCLALPGGPRVMIATGLHQDPFPSPMYYHRLSDHAGFLAKAGVPHRAVGARMSRDFVVECDDEAQARVAASALDALQAPDGEALFAVDNRGRDLFVELTYPKAVTAPFVVHRSGAPLFDAAADIVFVALKNGEHNGIGYFIDTGQQAPRDNEVFPLTALLERVLGALGVRRSGVTAPGADIAAA